MDGRLIEEIAVNSLHTMSSGEVFVRMNDVSLAVEIIAGMLGIDQFVIVNDYRLKVYGSNIPEHIINRTIANHNIEVSEIFKRSYSLEQYFMDRKSGGKAHA